jgi:hypothetical protein
MTPSHLTCSIKIAPTSPEIVEAISLAASVRWRRERQQHKHATAAPLGFVDLGQRRVARCGLTIVRGKGNRGGGGLAERHVVAAPTRPFVVSRVAGGVAYDHAVK